MNFLPLSRADMIARGWDRPDFVYVTGDAYVDHPSFGVSIISRVLEAAGYRVAILSQPDYKSCDAFREYGRPRLGFLVTSGNIDSMVAHYTASKKRRSFDYYSPGGEMGNAPIALSSSTRTASAKRTAMSPSSSAASKPRSAALPTTTIGITRCAARFSLTVPPIF